MRSPTLPRGAKHGPLPRLLRQLRISWDELELAEQQGSSIAFPDIRLRFSNDPAVLSAEIDRCFPAQCDNYQRLLSQLLDYDELDSLKAAASAAKFSPTPSPTRSWLKCCCAP